MRFNLVNLVNHGLWKFHHGDASAKSMIITQNWKAYDIWLEVLSRGHTGHLLRYDWEPGFGDAVLLTGGWFAKKQQDVLQAYCHLARQGRIKLFLLNEDNVLDNFRKVYNNNPQGIAASHLITNHEDPEFWARQKGFPSFASVTRCTYPATRWMKRFKDEGPDTEFGYVGRIKPERRTLFEELHLKQLGDFTPVGKGWIEAGYSKGQPWHPLWMLMKGYHRGRYQLHFSDRKWIPFKTLTPRVAQSLYSDRPVLFHSTAMQALPTGVVEVPVEMRFDTIYDLKSMMPLGGLLEWQKEYLLPWFEPDCKQVVDKILEVIR